jgi:predicted N-acetyltransferase YhbS
MSVGNIVIKPETPDDYKEAENMTREAFWDVYRPGCNEHLVLHNLRNSPAFVTELDLIAVEGDKIVGNIVYSRAKVIDEQGRESVILCMGPFAVLPDYQKKGIGSELLKRSVERARELGYKAVIIFGEPDYYHKFGFKNAAEYGIKTAEGENLEPFMALELQENGLKGISGRFYYDAAYNPSNEELEAFEKEFSPKEKHVRPGQLFSQ